MIISLVILSSNFSSKNQKNTDIRSNAQTAGNTITVCPNDAKEPAGCTFNGGDGIQQAIDSAKDGDMIVMKSGNYRRNSFTQIEGEKYNQCFISTKGKNLTIRGEGKALIEGQNDELGTGTKGLFRVGICVQKGKVAIDNIWVQQTLSHALALSETSAKITNFYTTDIDNIPVMIRRGTQAIIANSFINGPMYIDDDSYVRVINNTFYGGGVHLNLCRERYPSTVIFNNIFSYNKTGIEVECIDQKEKLKGTKAGYNLVWKYGTSDGVGDDSKPLGEPDCSGGEFCDFPGRLIASPSFKAPAIYGDVAWSPWTDFSFKDEGSAAKGAGEGGADLGMYGNACTSANSLSCSSISQQLDQLVPPATPTSAIPIIENPPPEQLPDAGKLLPTKKITSGTDTGPPITYYLPPTMGFTNPNNPPPNNSPSRPKDDITPTITPTPKPLIDVGKTVETVKNTWSNFITSVINFTKTILP